MITVDSPSISCRNQKIIRMIFELFDCVLKTRYVFGIVFVSKNVCCLSIFIAHSPDATWKKAHQNACQFTRTQQTLQRKRNQKKWRKNRNLQTNQQTFKSRLSKTRKMRPPVPRDKNSRNATFVS